MSDAHRALLLRHMPDERDDRVAGWLAARGFGLQACCPAHGSPLPDAAQRFDLMVVYGGVQSANDGDPWLAAELDWIRRWVEQGRPYLGLCLGGQLLARAFGARVAPHEDGQHEIGYVEVHPEEGVDDFLSQSLHVFQWHGEGFEVPAEGRRVARGSVFPNQAFRIGDRAYGLQFHPEVTREMIAQWNAQSGDVSHLPGAHVAQRQMRDAAEREAPMGTWLEGFLGRWLAACGADG